MGGKELKVRTKASSNVSNVNDIYDFREFITVGICTYYQCSNY